MPTVTNAALITIKYCVAIHLSARAAKRLIIEMPLTISTFPPLVPGIFYLSSLSNL